MGEERQGVGEEGGGEESGEGEYGRPGFAVACFRGSVLRTRCAALSPADARKRGVVTNFLHIPFPEVPTPEETKRNTLSSWQAVEPTLLSGLHPEILALSIPTMFFSVPMDEVDPDWIDCFDGKGSVHEQIIGYGREALRMFPAFFFKLDSRSPKDWGIVRYTSENLHELPGHIFSSERMLDDLVVQSYHRDRIELCFRKSVVSIFCHDACDGGFGCCDCWNRYSLKSSRIS
ncbi:hypothetical protein [Fimbriiglobus ruber]|uniref:hypothetical protein n=1 Tax=Fimbriiglobus ruber TaxID=1908690 RepID=UPI001179D078|nr:hypothetical protein [Fimbriiglobus ruber]